MNLLRETIRRIIQESACASLNNKLSQAIAHMQESGITLEFEKYPDEITVRLRRKEAPNVVGYIETNKAHPNWHGGLCHNAYIVGNARVRPFVRGIGIGALLYDVLLELAGDDGVAADRSSVSEDAMRNWNYFYNSNEYTKKPLDTKDGEYTDEYIDDCDGTAYLEHYEENFDTWDPLTGRPPKEEYQAMPINNVCIKNDKSMPTLKCLDEHGLLKTPLP